VRERKEEAGCFGDMDASRSEFNAGVDGHQELCDRHIQRLLAGSAVEENSGEVGPFHAALPISGILYNPFDALELHRVERCVSP